MKKLYQHFPYQCVYEYLHVLKCSQFQQVRKPQDLMELKQNYQTGSWSEEETAARGKKKSQLKINNATNKDL